MTTAQAVGAASNQAAEWFAIDWRAVRRNVRRLQARIVQAVKANRWGKVKALQRLLTHSYSGKVLAVRRVTENAGRKTPGVDQVVWDSPEDKIQAEEHSNGRERDDCGKSRKRRKGLSLPYYANYAQLKYADSLNRPTLAGRRGRRFPS